MWLSSPLVGFWLLAFAKVEKLNESDLYTAAAIRNRASKHQVPVSILGPQHVFQPLCLSICLEDTGKVKLQSGCTNQIFHVLLLSPAPYMDR
jgi:hypothetical protein